jgi:hypothetical protein
VSSAVRASLDARPEGDERGHAKASVDGGFGGRAAEAVVDVAVDAVVVDEVAGAEGVSVVCEGAVGDALVGPDAVATEAVDAVEKDRFGEGAGVAGFFPVPGGC